jgi:aldehyde dehydrogenase (NAD+)
MEFPFSRSNLPKNPFIDNGFVKPSTTQTLSLFNPKDRSLVADDVAIAGEKEVDAAVLAAEKAFPVWKNMPAVRRKQILERFASLVEANRDVLSELTRITLGSPKSSADIDFFLQV